MAGDIRIQLPRGIPSWVYALFVIGVLLLGALWVWPELRSTVMESMKSPKPEQPQLTDRDPPAWRKIEPEERSTGWADVRELKKNEKGVTLKHSLDANFEESFRLDFSDPRTIYYVSGPDDRIVVAVAANSAGWLNLSHDTKWWQECREAANCTFQSFDSKIVLTFALSRPSAGYNPMIADVRIVHSKWPEGISTVSE